MRRASLAWLALSAGCAIARPPAASAPTAAAQQAREESATSAAAQWQGGPSAPPAPTTPSLQMQLPGRQPLGGAAVAPAPSAAPPAEPRPEPPAPLRPSRVGGPQDASSPEVERPEAALAWHEAQLRAAVARISADAATCRDLCGASATICRAAGEICRLTQDADRATPRDPRCRNARLACDDAGRRRDGACPTCPDAR